MRATAAAVVRSNTRPNEDAGLPVGTRESFIRATRAKQFINAAAAQYIPSHPPFGGDCRATATSECQLWLPFMMAATTTTTKMGASTVSYRDFRKYQWLGPTSLHLRLEAFLLFCLLLLVVANFQQMYRDGREEEEQQQGGSAEEINNHTFISFLSSIPSLQWGDCAYIGMVSLWLSRHLLYRWLCLSDLGTSRAPTLRGFLSAILTSPAMSSGHSFERPPSQLILAKYFGSPYHGSSSGGSAIGDSSSNISGAGGAPIFFWQLVPYSIRYALHYVNVTFVHPMLDLWFVRGFVDRIQRWWNDFWSSLIAVLPSIPAQLRQRQSSWRNLAFAIQQRLYLVWVNYTPTFSFLVPATTMAVYILKLLHMTVLADPDDTAMTSSLSSSLTSLGSYSNKKKSEDNSDDETMIPYGTYQKQEIPSWYEVALYITLLGTLTSLGYFFRLIMPVPDQVACSNVIKDLRRRDNKGVAAATGGTGGGGGGATRSVQGGGRRGSSSAASSSAIFAYEKDPQDETWQERFRPIRTENRFRLAFGVRLLRTIENVFLCGVFPRTSFICRATRHCPEGYQLWELARSLYPAGVSTPLRKDGMSFGGSVSGCNLAMSVWIIAAIAIVTVMMLLAQAVLLSKTYLATLGFLASEWELVTPSSSDDGDDAVTSKTTPPTSSSTKADEQQQQPPPWDPRRRYNAGALVLYPPTGPRQAVYRATTSSPEARPSDLQLRLEQTLMKQELGHPGTSMLIARAAVLLLALAGVQIVLFLGALALGYSSDGMIALFAAYAVAAYALLTAAAGTNKRNRDLETLNKEICRGVVVSGTRS